MFRLCLFAQTNEVIGDYFLELINTDKNIIKYTLHLNKNGTYLFHSYTYNRDQISPIINRYGKGKWTISGMVISFKTNTENDIDEKHNLDFSNTKARFITKHPRNKTKTIPKTRLQFFESKIHWIKKIVLLKK